MLSLLSDALDKVEYELAGHGLYAHWESVILNILGEYLLGSSHTLYDRALFHKYLMEK